MASLLGGLFILAGCSSGKKAQEAKRAKAKKAAAIIDAGPQNRASTVFLDKTKEYGLEGIHAVTMNAVDLNFDGATDLVVLPYYYHRPKFFLYDKKKNTFTPWDHDPLPEDFKASFLVIADINRDHIPDMVSGILNQRSEVMKIPLKLLKGQMKNGLLTFSYDSGFIKLPVEPTSSVSLVDFNLDGYLDIFVANWFSTHKGQYIPTADRLLKNNKGKFEDVSSQLKGESVKASDQIYPPNARPTYGASTCDIDQNGWPDILTASSAGQKNKLWMNLKDSFEDVGAVSQYASDPNGSLVPTGGGRTFFSACTDYNDDGLMDVFLGELSHAYDNDSVDRSSMLTGAKTTYPPAFIRTEYLAEDGDELWNEGDRRGVWLDYNLDGHIDLLVENSGFPPHSRLVLFEQDSQHGFSNVARASGIDIINPMATVVADFNGDGKPDIVTSQNNIRRSDIPPRLFFFENNVSTKGHRSIRVNLSGRKSNLEAFGAMVMLYTTEKKTGKRIIQRRWNETFQGGLASQNGDGVIFGVSDEVEVNGIKVIWPALKANGKNIEQLYQVTKFGHRESIEVTVCEDGKILSGKVSCL